MDKFSLKSIGILILLAGTIAVTLYFYSPGKIQYQYDITQLNDIYSKKIQPIFNNKCVACHSCFNSPCQLNLTSYEGVIRGASKNYIYDFPKLEARPPTRLYTDASSTQQWRKKGFHSVLDTPQNNILSYLINSPKGIESGLQKKYESETSNICLSSLEEEELEKYKQHNPAGRMPYGFPGLEENEIASINKWISDGHAGPMSLDIERKIIENKVIKPLINNWENFFNGQTLKQKIASRYLYEHLFLASIYFEEFPNLFFRLVRSKTHKNDINEIGTVYPFDDPGTDFAYRLRPITNTIVHKSHIPFLFSKNRQKKWKQDFFESQWRQVPKEMPAYGASGSNPFKTFSAIPTKAKYEFFLANSNYHIMTFIKGPVCRGKTALNVINDHFWVLFIDPKQDVMVSSTEAYDKIADEIIFPSAIGDDFSPLINFRDSYFKSVQTKFKYLKNQTELSANSIWNGNKKDKNATITVFRHFDSATVLHGLRGSSPKTVWVLDYQVFESIYYNLTAGYNVFGPVLHQLNSRLFMEVSRVASEDMFISFLPKKLRNDLRKSWNLDVPDKKESALKYISDILTSDAHEKLSKEYVFPGNEIVSKVPLNTTSPKKDLLRILKKNHYSEEQHNPASDISENLSELDKLASSTIQYLPDTILIKVNSKEDTEIWTLIHNKDHYNVSMLLFENDRRRPEKDSLDLIKGVATSYANLFIILEKKNIAQFISDLKLASTQAEVWSFMKKYALSRNDPNFWLEYNAISEMTANKLSNESGLLDLNRYLNL